MKKFICVPLALVSVVGTFLCAYKGVLSQDSVCYSVQESGDIRDLSELCDLEGTPSADQTAKVEALTEKARILATKGKYREALDLTDQVLSIKPDFADVYLYRGTIYGLTQDLETAIE